MVGVGEDAPPQPRHLLDRLAERLGKCHRHIGAGRGRRGKGLVEKRGRLLEAQLDILAEPVVGQRRLIGADK